MEFNEKLQELRKQKKLTQEQLAEQPYAAVFTFFLLVIKTIMLIKWE